MAKIAPSLLAADFTCLEQEIKKIEEGGADIIHVDVMDGHFVPNLSMGPFVVEAVRRITARFIDVHLMIDNPEKYLKQFIAAGGDNITIHAETCGDRLSEVLEQIRAGGAQRGISIKPGTPLSAIEHLKGEFDLLLLMSVEPGFGGQKFIESTYAKIREARELFGEAVEIEIDGGVTADNAVGIIKAGADILVAGTAVFKAADPAQVIQKMKGE